MTLPDSEIRQLLNNLPGMVYRGYHDEQRTLLFASDGSLALTGYHAHQLQQGGNISFGELIHQDDRTAVWQEIEAAIEGKRPYRCIYRLGQTDRQSKWVLDRGEARQSANGHLLEGFISDHTERITSMQLLERRVADRTRKLSALYEIMEIANQPAPLPATLSHILEHILTAVKTKAGTIHLQQKGSPSLRLTAHQGLPTAITPQLTTIHLSGQHFIAQIWQQKSPQIHTDIQLPHWPQCCYVGIPIRANERMYGVLSLYTADPDPFHRQGGLDLLLSVGEKIGGVIENVHLREQAERLMVAEERNRLARALHDSVTQSLYSVTLFAEAGRNLGQAQAYERAVNYFEDVLQTGQQALKEMRLLVHNLRPSALEQEGLVAALQHRLNAVEGRAGIHHELVVAQDLSLTAELEEAIYHISQEALNNSIKHAFASKVKLSLQQAEDGQVLLQICDNGQGFEMATAVSNGGLGLTSIQERVALLRGTVTFHASPQQGTLLTVQLPQNIKRRT